ncbi:hypothetical protein BDD12DRAFT_53043 [Trichophaea hybrida]|nr:hypothetical protein BDD12DRAFT_53043 [Trichophaea hybrida]
MAPRHQYKITPGSGHGFVPFTLYTITFLSFAILCLLYIGGLEYLYNSKALAVSASGLHHRLVQRSENPWDSPVGPHGGVPVPKPIFGRSAAAQTAPDTTPQVETPAPVETSATTSAPFTNGIGPDGCESEIKSETQYDSGGAPTAVAIGHQVICHICHTFTTTETYTTLNATITATRSGAVCPARIDFVSTVEWKPQQPPTPPVKVEPSTTAEPQSSFELVPVPDTPPKTKDPNTPAPQTTKNPDTPTPPTTTKYPSQTVTLPSLVITTLRPSTALALSTTVHWSIMVVPAQTRSTEPGVPAETTAETTRVVALSTAVVKVPSITQVQDTVLVAPTNTEPVLASVGLVTMKDKSGTGYITTLATIIADTAVATPGSDTQSESSSFRLVTMVKSGGSATYIATILAGPVSTEAQVVSKEATPASSSPTFRRTTVVQTYVSGSSTILESRTYYVVPKTTSSAPTESPTSSPTGLTGPGYDSTSNSFIYKIPTEFLGQFLLTIIAVVLTLLWKAIDIDIKRMEPWYGLSDGRGVSGADLMTFNLVFTNIYIAPLLAAVRTQWIPALSSLIYCLLILVQLLSSVTVFVAAEGHCRAFGTKHDCRAYVSIRPVFVRALEGVLALIVACVILVALLQWLRQSKIMLGSEPFSIVGIAMLITEPDALETLGRIDAGCSEEAMRQRISNTQFRLVEYTHPDPDMPTKVILAAGSEEPDEGEGYVQGNVALTKPRVVRPLMLRGFVLAGFAVLLIGTATLVLVYRFVRNTALEKFMDSESAGVRIFIMGLGIIIRSLWDPIDRGIRYLEAFRLLKKRHQPPRNQYASTMSAIFQSCLLSTPSPKATSTSSPSV